MANFGVVQDVFSIHKDSRCSQSLHGDAYQGAPYRNYQV